MTSDSFFSNEVVKNIVCAKFQVLMIAEDFFRNPHLARIIALNLTQKLGKEANIALFVTSADPVATMASI